MAKRKKKKSGRRHFDGNRNMIAQACREDNYIRERFTAILIITLREEWNFGEKRLQRFFDEMGELDQAVRSGRISGLSDFMIMIREETGLELRPYPLPNDLRHLKGIREEIRYRRLIAFTALRTGFSFGAKRLEQFSDAMDRNQIDFGEGRLKITVDKDGMMKYVRKKEATINEC